MRSLLNIMLLFLTASLISTSLFAQSVTVLNGKAMAYKGEEVTAYAYMDFITLREKKLASTKVDEKGDFQFKLDITKIQLVFLKIGKTRGNLFLEPKGEYLVTFPAKDTVANPAMEVEKNVDLAFYLKDSLDINALIIDYNGRFDKFWSANYQYFVQKRSRFKLDSFKLATRQYYAKIRKPYFHTYVDYNLAAIEENTFGRGQNNIFRDYLSSRPICYDNSEYMNFFNEFFKSHLQEYTQTKEGANVPNLVNEKASYSGLMESLALDKYLKNDTLRELVLLKGLWEFYFSGRYNKVTIVQILEDIHEKSKIVEHRTIANNMLNVFPRLVPGNKAPGFTLKDSKGKEVNLSDFKGKYVYLNFWATWCTSCLQEMKLIQDYKKKYGDKIIFISISTDTSMTEMKNFLIKNPKYDWVQLYSDDITKENYEIKTVPSYFLINDKGLFIQAPAAGPTQNIEETLYKIAKPKEKKTGVGDKKNK